MNLKSLKKYVRPALNIATDVIPKLPAVGDSPLMLLVKLVAIGDSFNKYSGKGGNLVYSFFAHLKADQYSNAQFVDLFFNTPVHESFEIDVIELDEYRVIRRATKKGYGTLYFAEYRWGTKPEIVDEFYATPGFPFDSVLETLWDVFDGSLHIELRREERDGRVKTAFSSLPSIDDPLSSKATARLERLSRRIATFQRRQEACTYLFLGKQGAGKTTMAQRLAVGKRCARVDAIGLTSVGVQDLDFLLRQLGPDFLLVDDIDKCGSVATVLPTLLSLLSDMRRKYPELIVILTAADAAGLDPALVRPQRIDKIVKFELPDEDERRELLRTYGVEGASIDRFVELTEGLTPAYLQGIGAQVKCGDPILEIIEDIKLMKELSEPKVLPGAGGTLVKGEPQMAMKAVG